MKRRLVKRPQSLIDALECADWIARDSPEMAEAFLESLEITLRARVATPFLGHLAGFTDPRVSDLRLLAVRRFRRHLIIHRITDTTVEVVRVCHGARDLPAMLRLP